MSRFIVRICCFWPVPIFFWIWHDNTCFDKCMSLLDYSVNLFFLVSCGIARWWPVVDIGWGEWGSCLRPPLFWGPPLENSIYSFGFAQWTIWSEDLFFFFLENTLILGEKYPSPDQTSFFSQTTWIFENSCLGPLNWNIHHWWWQCKCVQVFYIAHV